MCTSVYFHVWSLVLLYTYFVFFCIWIVIMFFLHIYNSLPNKFNSTQLKLNSIHRILPVGHVTGPSTQKWLTIAMLWNVRSRFWSHGDREAGNRTRWRLSRTLSPDPHWSREDLVELVRSGERHTDPHWSREEWFSGVCQQWWEAYRPSLIQRGMI
jgi:hypothetical protein